MRILLIAFLSICTYSGVIGQGITSDNLVQTILNEYQTDNVEQAIVHIQQAADQKSSRAQYVLGMLYENGKGMGKDMEKATQWYRKAAKQSNGDATERLGKIYELGIGGVEVDLRKAFGYYQKTVAIYAANQEGKPSQPDEKLGAMIYRVGFMCENGSGTPQNKDKALDWYNKAADNLHAGAMERIVTLHKLSPEEVFKVALREYHVNNNLPKAVIYLRLAAEQEDSNAQNMLGVFYEKGEGLEKDEQKALHWYHKAAAQLNSIALTHLWKAYKTGTLGVQTDEEKAFGYLLQAAEIEGSYLRPSDKYQPFDDQGPLYLTYQLGLMYEKGEGTSKSVKKAVYWYEKSANLDHMVSVVKLMRIYKYGSGEIEKNLAIANYWKGQVNEFHTQRFIENAHPEDGYEAFSKYITTHLTYPQQAIANKIDGNVYVSFTVDTDGTLSSVKVIKGLGNGCDEEALRLIQEGPKWKPGIKDEQPVARQVILPIIFQQKK